MLKVNSPMATSLLRVGRTAGLLLVDEYLAAANVWLTGAGRPVSWSQLNRCRGPRQVQQRVRRLLQAQHEVYYPAPAHVRPVTLAIPK